MPRPTSPTLPSVSLPAGVYYLGDPCYAFGSEHQEQWEDLLLSKCNCFEDSIEGEVDGFKVYATSTAHGDGSYDSNVGFVFPVDAGLLGAVPEALVRLNNGEATPFGMLRVEFDKPVTMHALTQDGRVIIGHVVIDTDPEDEPEDDSSWASNDEEDDE